MGRKKTVFESARDHMFSEMHRCGVLDASREDAERWLDDTIDYLRSVYGSLSRQELEKLYEIGARFAKTPIPHGGDSTALNREEWASSTA